MPYHVGKSKDCPSSKPYAVIKDSDGKVMGCHETQEAAGKQIGAIESNEKAEQQIEEYTQRLEEIIREAKEEK